MWGLQLLGNVFSVWFYFVALCFLLALAMGIVWCVFAATWELARGQQPKRPEPEASDAVAGRLAFVVLWMLF